MLDRFDLEEQIVECWSITDELKDLNSQDELVQAIALLYEHKFQRLWSTFEECVKNGSI